MTKAIDTFKAQARRLFKHMASIVPGFTYAQALEATAALHGAADWRTLRTQPATLEAPACQCGPITPLILELAEKYGGGDVWGQHPDHPRSDWAYEAENGDTWQSYWIWLLGKLESAEDADGASEEAAEGRYFISEGWSHLFGRHEDTVRWVFDMTTNHIVFMEVHVNIGDTWLKATPHDIADVEDSLKNANDELFTDPEKWDVDVSDELPDWAK